MPWDNEGNWIEEQFGNNLGPDPGDIAIDLSDMDAGDEAWQQDFDQQNDLAGGGTGTYSGNLELEWTEIVEQFFPEEFSWDVAESYEDWYERYGHFFHAYDPFEEKARGKQRDLEVSKWEEKILKDKNSLDFKTGAGGFVTSGQAKEYEDTLTKLAQTEFLEGQLSKELDVYNFQKDWQEEILDQINELSELGAFAERGDEGVHVNDADGDGLVDGTDSDHCSSDDDCRYGTVCIDFGSMSHCADPDTDTSDQGLETNCGECTTTQQCQAMGFGACQNGCCVNL